MAPAVGSVHAKIEDVGEQDVGWEVHVATHEGNSVAAGPWRAHTWQLWRLPASPRAYVIVVDIVGVACVIPFSFVEAVRASDLLILALLAAGDVVHIETARHVERLREVAAERYPMVDFKSVWTFAGLLLLPVGLALVLVALTFVYSWARVARCSSAHRWWFSCMTVLLGTVAAWTVLRLLPLDQEDLRGPWGLIVVCLAALTRWTVNHGIVVGVYTLMEPTTSWIRRFLAPVETMLGLGSLAIGAVVAALFMSFPWLIPVLLAPLMVMHRGLLVKQLVAALNTDAKTGLATAACWQAHAARALARARRRHLRLGVLMVDLDEFKRVNDRWGHLVGDQVLQAVADVLADEVRTPGAVGRFGGEEFVVLLDDTGVEEIAGTAERIRARSCAIAVEGTAVPDVSVSIGTACCHDPRIEEIDDLVLAADVALYEAKRAGRNRVCSALPAD